MAYETRPSLGSLLYLDDSLSSTFPSTMSDDYTISQLVAQGQGQPDQRLQHASAPSRSSMASRHWETVPDTPLANSYHLKDSADAEEELRNLETLLKTDSSLPVAYRTPTAYLEKKRVQKLQQRTKPRDPSLRHIQGTGLEFQDVSCYVMKKLQLQGHPGSVKQEIQLLHAVTGVASKGEVTAIMGPKGAGKFILLSALAGRLVQGDLDGVITLDGRPMSPPQMKKVSTYVMLGDHLFPMLTVWETLWFAAEVRLDPSLSRAAKIERVTKLIDQLGLTKVRNKHIGDEKTRGISKGQKRRVSIGVDVIHGPALLYMDNPTSGLDSSSAHNIIEKVRAFATAGSTVILTVHEPSFQMLMLLDRLIVLARGQVIFQGGPKFLSTYLSGLGKEVPRGENPMDYFLEVVEEYDEDDLGILPLVQYNFDGTKPSTNEAIVEPTTTWRTPGSEYMRTSHLPSEHAYSLDKSMAWDPRLDIERHSATFVRSPLGDKSRSFKADESSIAMISMEHSASRPAEDAHEAYDHSITREDLPNLASSFYKGLADKLWTPRGSPASSTTPSKMTEKSPSHRTSRRRWKQATSPMHTTPTGKALTAASSSPMPRASASPAQATPSRMAPEGPLMQRNPSLRTPSRLVHQSTPPPHTAATMSAAQPSLQRASSISRVTPQQQQQTAPPRGPISRPPPGPPQVNSTRPANFGASEITPATPSAPLAGTTPTQERNHVSLKLNSARVKNYSPEARRFANQWWREVVLLMIRDFKNLQRTPELSVWMPILITVMGFVMATLFAKTRITYTSKGVIDTPVDRIFLIVSFFVVTICLFFLSFNLAVPEFITARFIFIRESSHSAYRTSSYVTAGVIVPLPFLALQALTYALITWWVLGFQNMARNNGFVFFFLILFASLLCTSSIFLLICSMVRTYMLGFAIVIGFAAVSLLTCGFFLPRTRIPNYWIWLHYLSAFKYAYEAMLVNAFGANSCLVPAPSNESSHGCVTGSFFLNEDIQVSHLTKWWSLGVLLGMAVFYRLLFYGVLRLGSLNRLKIVIQKMNFIPTSIPTRIPKLSSLISKLLES